MAKRRNKAARRQEIGQEAKRGSHLDVYLICAALVLAALAVYWPVAGYEFINCDDNVYVQNNAVVRGPLTVDSIRYAFTSTAGGNWMPMVWLSYCFDHSLGSDSENENPTAYHVSNLILHIANGLLLFLALNAMTGQKWRSGFVALLFAVHPLHVESVAWVAERKDTLSTLFWLLTMLAYVWYVRSPGWRRYALVLGAFVLGTMSKPMLVTLPVVLLLIDVWPLRRLEQGRSLGRLVVEKLPLLAISGAACAVAVMIQKKASALTSLHEFPIGVRLANAAVSTVTYIRKMVWPNDLAWQYPHPGATLPVWEIAGSVILLAAVTVIGVRVMRRKPYVGVGWFWYLVTLLPVIGLVQVGQQGMADRYTYVPLIGIFILITWGAAEIAGRLHAEKALAALAGVTAVVLMAVAYHQVGFWRDSESVCERAIAVNPANAVAHNNLGLALLNPIPTDPAIMDRAVRHLKTALDLDPDQIGAEYGLGTALLSEADAVQDPQRKKTLTDEATKHFTKAVEMHKRRGTALDNLEQLATAENNLAVLLWKQGKKMEALEYAEAAARACPDNADIMNTRGFIRQHLGLDPEGR